VSTGALQIEVEFSEVGKELFAAITRRTSTSASRSSWTVKLYAAPVIRAEISQGKAQITGAFTEEEAAALAAKINDAINRP
jgi:preprotein translocase subunit SecD